MIAIGLFGEILRTKHKLRFIILRVGALALLTELSATSARSRG